jgi:hypothetical protein
MAPPHAIIISRYLHRYKITVLCMLVVSTLSGTWYIPSQVTFKLMMHQIMYAWCECGGHGVDAEGAGGDEDLRGFKMIPECHSRVYI